MPANDEEPFNPDKLFDKFKEYFNYKFDNLTKQDKSSEDSSVKELRNKLEAKELSKPGNTAQFEFCGKLELALDKIKSALSQEDTHKANEALQEAEALVQDRKKTIKIADSSKAGWATIQELNKTGKDVSSEEKKRILVAEESALKSIERRKRLRQSTPSSSYNNAFKDPADRSLFRGLQNADLCFNCKMPGHWARECPFNLFASIPRVKTPGPSGQSFGASRAITHQ